MVIATLFHFGLGTGCGGDSLSQFFKMIRIDTHIGVSPSVLRKLLNEMEGLLPQFQKECESQLDDKSRKIVAGLDEMDALPLPRKSRGRSIAKPLILESVPS